MTGLIINQTWPAVVWPGITRINYVQFICLLVWCFSWINCNRPNLTISKACKSQSEVLRNWSIPKSCYLRDQMFVEINSFELLIRDWQTKIWWEKWLNLSSCHSCWGGCREWPFIPTLLIDNYVCQNFILKRASF